MYTTKSIRLNAKIERILQLIQQVNNQIEEQRSRLHHYDHEVELSMIRIMYTRSEITDRIVYKKMVKQRLINYYEGVLHALILEAFKHGIAFDNQINNLAWSK